MKNSNLLNDHFPRTAQVICNGISQGLHSGAQVYVAQHGQELLNSAFGEIAPGQPLRHDHLLLWLSSVKPLTAVMVAQLWEQGKLTLDDPVSKFIPEFAQSGKATITIRHVLTHTGGFRSANVRWQTAPWSEIIQKICETEIEPAWIPGRKAGYHAASGWFILGEMIQRITGGQFSRYAREVLLEPLGMLSTWIGMTADEYRSVQYRLGLMYQTEGGKSSVHPFWGTEEGITLCRPGGGGYGPISELGRFYQMLLNGGMLNGTRILSSQNVEAITSRHRTGMKDQTFRRCMDWGLGFIMDSKLNSSDPVPYGFGPHSSPRTYGHGGYQSSVGFADPEFGLVVCWIFNGTPGEKAHQARGYSMNKAIYEDLDIRW